MGKLSLYSRRRVVSLSIQGNMSNIGVTRVLAEEGIKVCRISAGRFLRSYRANCSLFDAPRSGRKSKLSEELLTFIDEKMKENDELTSEELRKMVANYVVLKFHRQLFGVSDVKSSAGNVRTHAIVNLFESQTKLKG